MMFKRLAPDEVEIVIQDSLMLCTDCKYCQPSLAWYRCYHPMAVHDWDDTPYTGKVCKWEHVENMRAGTCGLEAKLFEPSFFYRIKQLLNLKG